MKEPAPLQSAEEDPWAGSRLGKIGLKVKNIEHVIVDEDEQFRCCHCQETHTPSRPMRAPEFAERLLGFVRMHRLCQKAAPPDRQLKLQTADAVMGAVEPVPYAKFEQRYPLPRTLEEMLDACSFGLTGEQFQRLRETCTREPTTAMFDAAATWGRIERAHSEAAYRARDGAPAIAGLTIPARTPMPEKVAELIRAPEAPARKKRSRKS